MQGWDATLGDNVNGPSLIRAPRWLAAPLGKYYLYFAHHRGDHIRLACADHLGGPWRIFQGGTLRLARTPFDHHLASPDVHVDDDQQRILMYYHGKCRDSAEQHQRGNRSPQLTCLAESRDGVNFTLQSLPWATQYFRLFRTSPRYFALGKDDHGARTFHGSAWNGPFTPGPRLLSRARHAAVAAWDERLLVVYSRIGDAPEHLRACTLTLAEDWWDRSELTVEMDQELLRPEYDWEGADLDIRPSKSGPTGPAHELRDPAIFREDGVTYLVYAVRGESGLAIARIDEQA